MEFLKCFFDNLYFLRIVCNHLCSTAGVNSYEKSYYFLHNEVA